MMSAVVMRRGLGPADPSGGGTYALPGIFLFAENLSAMGAGETARRPPDVPQNGKFVA